MPESLLTISVNFAVPCNSKKYFLCNLCYQLLTFAMGMEETDLATVSG